MLQKSCCVFHSVFCNSHKRKRRKKRRRNRRRKEEEGGEGLEVIIEAVEVSSQWKGRRTKQTDSRRERSNPENTCGLSGGVSLSTQALEGRARSQSCRLNVLLL